VGSNNKRRRKKDELLESGLPGLGASSPGEHKLKVRLSGMTTGTYDDQTMVVLKANRTSFSARGRSFKPDGDQLQNLWCFSCNVSSISGTSLLGV